jgi:TonB family protein
MARRLAAVAAATLLVSAADITAQTRRPPPPQGNRIPAHDGDVILVEGDARVKFVHRREANVRTIYNAAERWIVVIVDYATGGGPDGRVDFTYHYTGLSGDWPLDERWEGPATVEFYSIAGETGPMGLGLFCPRGLIQLLGPSDVESFRDATAFAVLSFKGAGSGGGGGVSFDDAERQRVEQARRNAAGQPSLPAGASMSMTFGAGGTANTQTSVGGAAPAHGPMRVGGNIKAPLKLVDVAPVLPPRAAEAGIRGVVILELTIDTDGSVKEARVLRSIPLLDEEAVRAAKQWRYEPVLLNGKPIAIVMTVTVPIQ